MELHMRKHPLYRPFRNMILMAIVIFVALSLFLANRSPAETFLSLQ